MCEQREAMFLPPRESPLNAFTSAVALRDQKIRVSRYQSGSGGRFVQNASEDQAVTRYYGVVFRRFLSTGWNRWEVVPRPLRPI